MSPSPWHDGERYLQTRVGVTEQLEYYGPRIMLDHLPEQHRRFFNQLPYLMLGSVDEQGAPWATLIEGPPGFLSSPDPQLLQLDRLPADGDPIKPALKTGAAVGLLGIDLKTRRRNRLNGNISAVSSHGFTVSVVHAFGNCPQYIQRRGVNQDSLGHGSSTVAAEHLSELDDAAKATISQADTFFIASYVDLDGDCARRSVDVSHRGGDAGFVRIEGNVLTIPDYAGNMHFNTLGNLLLNPRAGLLFIDFESGDVLQLTGRTELILEGPRIATFAQAERLWTLTVEQVVRRRAALNSRWRVADDSAMRQLIGTWQPV
jgi:hypothetical protein